MQAAAGAFGNIDRLTVVNGAEGMGELFNQVLAMGAAAIPAIKSVLDGSQMPASPAANGHKGGAPVEVPPAS